MGLFWTPVLTSAYESVGQRRSLWPDLWTLKAFACYFVGLFWTPVLTSAYESVGQRSLLPDLWTLKDFCLLFFLKEIPLHPPERKRWQRDLSTSSNALSHLTRHLKHTTLFWMWPYPDSTHQWDLQVTWNDSFFYFYSQFITSCVNLFPFRIFHT